MLYEDTRFVESRTTVHTINLNTTLQVKRRDVRVFMTDDTTVPSQTVLPPRLSKDLTRDYRRRDMTE